MANGGESIWLEAAVYPSLALGWSLILRASIKTGISMSRTILNRRGLTLSALLVAFGCVSSLDALCRQPAPPRIQSIEDDKFDPAVKITGFELYTNPFGGTTRSWAIRSWVDKHSHTVVHQLYVEISYLGDWKFFHTAFDDTARSLEVVEIKRDTGDCSLGQCSLYETIGLQLDDSVLRSRLQQGYSVKISAKSGDSLVLDISPDQIRLQLDAVDKYRPHDATSSSQPNAVEQSTSANAALSPTVSDAESPKAVLGAQFIHVPFLKGVVITTVVAGSTAERAGIRQGDRVMLFAGRDIDRPDDLISAVGATAPGESVNVQLKRGKEDITVNLQF